MACSSSQTCVQGKSLDDKDNTVHCCLVHYNAIQCSAVQCSAVQCSTVQCSAVQWCWLCCPVSGGPSHGSQWLSPLAAQDGCSHYTALYSTLQCSKLYCKVCTLQCWVQCAVCSVQCAVCSMQCAVCSLVCSVQTKGGKLCQWPRIEYTRQVTDRIHTIDLRLEGKLYSYKNSCTLIQSCTVIKKLYSYTTVVQMGKRQLYSCTIYGCAVLQCKRKADDRKK